MTNTSIVEYMNKETVKENIQNTIGQKTPQFIASVASLVNSNPMIKQCEQSSIMSACLIAASLDLPINQNLGMAYIIPYSGKAQFQMGWKGFVQLAMRSGQFRTINVTDVKNGEIKNINRLTGEIEFTWITEDRESSEVVGYVAYMELLNGFSKQLYMTTEELLRHAGKYSQSFKRNASTMNVWRDNPDAMSKKTVIKQLLSKYAPMTIEMQKATLADQAVINEEGYSYPDNQLVDPSIMANEKEVEKLKKYIINCKSTFDLDQCQESVSALNNEELKTLYINKFNELGGR